MDVQFNLKMMKNLFYTVILMVFVACSTQRKEKENIQKYVTVSILPQKTFVEKIAGNDFKVNVLIPPGTSPAAYSLTPSQMGEIAQSSVWFRIGYIGFELSWKDKIAQTNTSMKVVDLSEGLDLIAQEKTDGGQETRGVDPHIWLSPVLVKEMSKKILAELTELYPQQSMKYKTNYNRFIAEIDSVDTEIRNMLDSVQGRKIITFHPVLSYFARNYGIEQYSLESGGKEPTPQKLKELTDLAKQEKIGVIYIQSELDRQQAEVFAEEVNGSVVQIRPLDPDWGKNLLEMSKTFVTHF